MNDKTIDLLKTISDTVQMTLEDAIEKATEKINEYCNELPDKEYREYLENLIADLQVMLDAADLDAVEDEE